MVKKLLLSIYVCIQIFSNLFAQSEEKIVLHDIEASKEHVIDQRQNYFLTSTDYRITPKVNPITGEYSEDEVDLVVAGSQPISMRRFYNSSSPYDPRYATWRYNPECFFVANLEWEKQEIFASIGDEDGSVCLLKCSSENKYTFDFEIPKGFLAFQADGQTHPSNLKIKYRKKSDPDDKRRYEYRGTITDGSGRMRSFASVMHRWTNNVHWKEKKGNWITGRTEKNWCVLPDTWTPYHIPITEEKLPNGNILCYTYTKWKKEKRNYPLPRLLSSITAYNTDKTKILGFIKLQYPRAKHDEVAGINIIGSDGRTARLKHSEEGPINLTSSQSPGKPKTNYSYESRLLKKISRPGGPFLTTAYSKGKVSAQYAPVGPNGEMESIGRYSYSSHMTQVIDAEGNRVDYHFDNHKRLECIAYLRNYSVYRQEHFERDPSTGNLTRRTVSDATNTPYQIVEYTYDKNHNPIEERVGNGKEWRTLTRMYSEDGFNLKLSETDRDEKIIRYTYIPDTNLLSSELTYEGNAIRKRIFHTYDDCAICIQTITDDGMTDDPYNLQGVTYRTITKTTPKYSTPCFGLPEIIEEKTIDGNGKEILLNKITYTYTPFGEILQEAHYDANGSYLYSIYNTYDDQERLISKTEPSGAKITYAYDANHNIISIAGPRADQYCEISYDKANRPIRTANWQTDGTILITEKKYNKLGQVIEEIDPCGQAMRFDYDEFGHITAVHHPDGAIERKEYDILGNIIREIDPEGYEITKIYNAFGQPLSIHYPDGSEEHFTYNSTGTISSHTDKNGAATNYTYDSFDHPICKETYSVNGKLVKKATSTWTPFLKLSEREDDLVTDYSYDFAGRKIAEKQGYRLTEYHYDPSGQLACTKEDVTCQIMKYDLCGRPIQIRTEKEGLLQKQEEYAYDEAGNCIHTITSKGIKETIYNTDGKPLRISDPLGQVTQFSYSYEGILTKTTVDPKGIQTVVSHDARGRETLRFKKDLQGQIIQQAETRYNKNGKPLHVTHTIFSGTEPVRTVSHSWEYGPLGRLERFFEAGEKETRYLYDSKGHLEEIIKPDGSRIIHTYDDLGRLIRYHSHDFDYNYTYDSRDRVTSIIDQKSRTLRSYDPLGNTLQEHLANDLTISNTYDAQGRRITCTLPDMSTITYSYNGAYLHSVSRNGRTHTYSHRNLEGQIIRAHTPAGEIQVERDRLGRYASIQAPSFSAQEYIYDPVGNLLSYHHSDEKGQIKHQYVYDNLNQLIHEDTHTYKYDSLHNRLQKDTNVYAINALSQVTTDGETYYSYDRCGNLISDGTRTYTYDSLDRLIAVEEGESKTEYAYDSFHRRLSKTTYLNGREPKTIRYLWDGKNEIGSVDEQGHLLELRVLGEGLGAEIGAAVLYELQGTTYVPIHDHRGSVVVLIDIATQQPIECYRYSAYGEEETENKLSPWRFSSKRTDEETDLIYFGRRYFNPALGRWITQDPQGFEDGPNLYAYVHNNPLTEIDLYGLWSIGQALSGLSRMTFQSIEWSGANLLPVPYFRSIVESIGRWGSGGELRGGSRYRSGGSEIITIPGRTVPGRSYTHGNGMLTRKENAIKQAEYISKTHGNMQVDLLYHGTEGFVMDLIGCGLSKLGIPTAYNKMCAKYYTDKLRDDPKHLFTSSVHSRGGIQMMNTGRLLTHDQRQHIDVISYGSATLIPKDYFRSAKNNLSFLDVVTMTNPLAFCMGLLGQQYDVNFLTPSTRCPLKAHGFLEATYAEEIRKRGDAFKDEYFN